MDILNLVLEILPILVAAASTVAAVTPTPQPGSWKAALYKIIDFLAINIGKAKETGQK